MYFRDGLCRRGVLHVLPRRRRIYGPARRIQRLARRSRLRVGSPPGSLTSSEGTRVGSTSPCPHLLKPQSDCRFGATRKSSRDRVQSAHRSCIPAAERQYGDGRASDPVEPLQEGREQQSKEARNARGELVLVDHSSTLIGCLAWCVGSGTGGEKVANRTSSRYVCATA